MGRRLYSKIGAKGGKKGRTGGFYANRELARIAGAKGGSISRRGKGVTKEAAENKSAWYKKLIRRTT